MLKVLVADDDELIREMVVKYGRNEGFEVTEASNGAQAIERCEECDFDVILLDVMMPKLDGFSACREIRKIRATPIIMLSALGEEYEKLHGFDLGISDYIVKPFSFKELMMRIKAVSRLMTGNRDTIVIGELKIDLIGWSVQIGTEFLQLSPKEAALLFYMAKNSGIALTREKLICNIWGYDYDGNERTLDSHIKGLRKNLREYGWCITTIKGVGYRFDEESN
ncbi:MAG: DNA-binding response regulator [Oscillospiraceae bacterium]|nr:DNA-binding response regulator [Oscillospiraceae bacterium]